MASKASALRVKYIEFRRAGHTPLESARLAGYASPNSNYVKVEEHPDVKAVVAEMEQEARNKLLYTREDAINDLKEGLRLAKLKGDFVGVKACVDSLTKLLDLTKTKTASKDITPNKRRVAKDLELMTEEELIEKLGGDKSVTLEGEFIVEDQEQEATDGDEEV